VAEGGTASEPGPMTKEFTLPSVAGLYRDPVFEYWYTTDAATAYSFSTPVTGNLTLHAKWTGSVSPVNIDDKSGDNVLAKALAYIAGESPANYTIVLDGGAYNLPPTTISKADAVITLVGKTAAEIKLSADGSLFTINAGELVLDNNITLKGRNPNNNSLVRVSGSSSFLRMKAGAFITGNTYSTTSASSSGGGVVVNGGTFDMSGGEVSGNTASSSAAASSGGGVVVFGTFTMSGGEVSGNTASSSYDSNGGGVDVAPNGTFTMSGGEVSGNTASSSTHNAYGGGVYVFGTFPMSGGEVSGNTVSSSSDLAYGGGGGGVSVGSGTFDMSGGVVSGNILSDTRSFGREVLVFTNGTFKMSGDARPQQIFLLNNTPYVTITGPLSGEPVPIDLGVFTNVALTNWLISWLGKPILALDSSYDTGNLAYLKTHFTLGNTKWTNLSPFTEAAIPDEYTIGDDGKLELITP
jgi:hypothetical protein